MYIYSAPIMASDSALAFTGVESSHPEKSEERTGVHALQVRDSAMRNSGSDEESVIVVGLSLAGR